MVLKMFSSLIYVLALLHFVPPTFGAEQQHVFKGKPSNPLDDKFAKLVKETLDFWHVPGIAIAVVDGDNTWAEGYGISAFPSTPVTPETLFYGASTTKAFTAAAIALLISSGNYSDLNWDTPISSIIRDDFVLPDPYFTDHVTIEDALSHRTGMPRHDFSYGGVDEKGEKRGVRDGVRGLRTLPLTAGLRTTFQYCNLMFVVASHVVETLTGVWLGDVLRERIWEPLGMKSTYFTNEAADAGPEPRAQGYVYHNEKYEEVPFMDLTIVSGAGSIISNVIDYSKWIRAFLTSSGPLSKSDYAALKAARSFVSSGSDIKPPFAGSRSYALGWFTGVYAGYEYFEHSGGMEAFGAQVLIIPELDLGFVAFGNTGVTSNAAELKLIYHLLDEKISLPKEKRLDWDKTHQEQFKNQVEKYEKAEERYYPSVPSPPLPLSLPLQNHTGTYNHPSYHNITIVLKDRRLHSDRDNASWKVFFDLEHVSGEYFMAYLDSTTAPGFIFKAAFPAEFVVESDGVVGRLGIAVEEEIGVGERIWFQRV